MRIKPDARKGGVQTKSVTRTGYIGSKENVGKTWRESGLSAFLADHIIVYKTKQDCLDFHKNARKVKATLTLTIEDEK